jgi:hypothetical protein
MPVSVQSLQVQSSPCMIWHAPLGAPEQGCVIPVLALTTVLATAVDEELPPLLAAVVVVSSSLEQPPQVANETKLKPRQ